MQIIHKGMALAAATLCLALTLPLISEAEAGATDLHHRHRLHAHSHLGQPAEEGDDLSSDDSDVADASASVPSQDASAEADAAAAEAVQQAAGDEGPKSEAVVTDVPKAPLSMVVSGAQHTHQDTQEPAPAEAAKADAQNAKAAAETAKQAASVFNKVAEHSVKITAHAQGALKHALGALHDARVETSGLDQGQKDSLKKAEAKLREATKTADYGELKKTKDASDLKKEKMEADLAKSKKSKTELEQMKQDVKELRKQLKEKDEGEYEDIDKALEELEDELDTLEKSNKGDSASNDELKAEIERLREQIDKLEENEGKVKYEIPADKKSKSHKLPNAGGGSDDKELMRDVKMKPLEGGDAEAEETSSESADVTPVQEKGIDIDTAMPYGDLEPFGREDTAQELTENSVRESDEMVDQLERAEVAEEKRAVSRALTRLRGAAITSFDGVARSQTGNIDEYNKIHKWRKTHPLHHLADEESDINKWAFPDNAD